MRLWRISNYQSLEGTGGLKASGRWHTRGRGIVYSSPNPAAALLEILVHLELDPAGLPVSYRLLEIDLPDDLPRHRIDLASLPNDWRENEAATQALGDRWLVLGTTVAVEVPSRIVPETFNVLLNPAHADMSRVRVVSWTEQPFDARLMRRF